MTLTFSLAFQLFLIIAAGLVAAIVLGPLAILVAKRAGLVDIPGAAAHKQHARPTPLAGGIALMVCVLALLSIFRLWQEPFIPLVAATVIVFIFGLLDDARGLSAPQKLVGQVLASLVLIASGNHVNFLSGLSITFLSPGLLTVFNYLVTVIWLVGIANSINLIDSMDGLALGVSSIAFAFFFGMTLVAQQYDLARFCGMMLGICAGLLIYNVSPARLFLGDSGAQTLGFILAAVGFLYTPDNFPQASSWFVPILILGIPIFDTTLVVISRLRQHRPLLRADRSHIYHRLVTVGLDPSRAVLAVHMTSLILSCLAFIALYLVPWQANLVFGLVVVSGVVLLVVLERNSHFQVDTHD